VGAIKQMINFKFSITNPFSVRWANIYNTGGYLTDNKSWEIQVMKSNDIVDVSIHFTMHNDHAGLIVEVGLLGYSIMINIYDNRHWNYENKGWEK
jgi:hypothetical protein